MNSDLCPLIGGREHVLEELERRLDLRQVRMSENVAANPRILSIPSTVQIVGHHVDEIRGGQHPRDIEMLKVLEEDGLVTAAAMTCTRPYPVRRRGGPA
jgi:hypothetical protein